MTILEQFLELVRAEPLGECLHTGSRRSNVAHSTLSTESSWFPAGTRHHGCDVEPGVDVELVCDLHRASTVLPLAFFDFVVSCSTFEHLEEPWTCAAELARVTRPGGLLFCQTHQTFPLHGYPSDYYRFSKRALESLFSPKRGWKCLAAAYEFPCSIVPRSAVPRWNAQAPAYLNVCCIARRIYP